MLNIVHLSDFHLNQKNQNDWNSYIKRALVSKINELNLDMSNTLFICTGDLLDKGGYDYNSIQEAFNVFKSEVIDFICKEFSISIDRFLLVPGNHDIIRKEDSVKIELGNREFFKTYDNILKAVKEILDKEDREGVKRIIPFSEFETSLYNNINRYSSFLGNAFKFNFNGLTIGVACLNSSWRAYDDEDKRYLILGEEQLNRCTRFIKDCDVKIALMHHPLDWFNLENNIISSHINKDYNLLFVGHVHESSTMIQTGFTGTLFTNIAPSCISDIRDDSKAFSNGFSVLKYNNKTEEIDCTYYKYIHHKKEYVLNTDLCENGRFFQKIPKQSSVNDQSLIEKCLTNVRNYFFSVIDEHVIAQKVNVATSIQDAFVMPPITLQDNNEEFVSLNEICKSKQNQFFFGAYEIGKTTLLYRLVREYVDEYSQLRKIPVYFDVNEIGNKEITTIIKNFLNCSTDEAIKLISQNLIVLIVDNLEYSEINEDKINKISKFLKENDDIKIIATATNELIGVPPQNYIKKTKTSFSHFYIRPFKSAQIKGLMTKWVPEEDSLKRDARLDKMVANFCSYSLPCTAMSVSLFLWSTENADRKPINQAVLLDIYIEIVLEKLAKENIYRSTFDYKNKTMLLAYIAEKMLPSENPNCSIDYGDYIKSIQDYLKSVNFKYDVSKIAEYFLERKIFSKTSENQVKYTHSCFFHFFLAKRMAFNTTFKASVINKKEYHKFPKEIDYFTGLTRNDESVLEFIFNQFEETFTGIEKIFDEFDVDRFFTYILKTEQEQHVPITKNLRIDKIKEGRPSEEQLMKFYDNKLSKIPQDLISKKIDDFNLEKLIIIMCTVLRNSEGVEKPELKKKIYNSIIRNTVAWSILYKDFIVQNVQKNNVMPPFISKEEDLVRFLKFLPMNIQGGVNNYLGTYKLTPIMLEKINQDLSNKKCSDIETYFSVTLYWDSQGANYHKYISKLIRRLSNNIVQDYCLLKLVDHYYRKTKPNTPEETIFIDMLTELVMKNENIAKKLTEKVKKSIRDGKQKFLNTNKYTPLK